MPNLPKVKVSVTPKINIVTEKDAEYIIAQNPSTLNPNDASVLIAYSNMMRFHIADSSVHVTQDDKDRWNSLVPDASMTVTYAKAVDLSAHVNDTSVHVSDSDRKNWNGKLNPDTSLFAKAVDFNSHVLDTSIHITPDERKSWNAKLNPDTSIFAKESDFEKHTSDVSVHITDAERKTWNAKMDADSSLLFASETDFAVHVADTSLHVTPDEKKVWNSKLDSSNSSLFAKETDLSTHINDASVHITEAEREKWNSFAADGSLDLSIYVKKDDFEKHVNDASVHITDDERKAWNGKLDSSNSSLFAKETDLSTHINDASIHITQAERDKWNSNSDGSLDLSAYVKETDFEKHTSDTSVHITEEEREKWNNKLDPDSSVLDTLGAVTFTIVEDADGSIIPPLPPDSSKLKGIKINIDPSAEIIDTSYQCVVIYDPKDTPDIGVSWLIDEGNSNASISDDGLITISPDASHSAIDVKATSTINPTINTSVLFYATYKNSNPDTSINFTDNILSDNIIFNLDAADNTNQKMHSPDPSVWIDKVKDVSQFIYQDYIVNPPVFDTSICKFNKNGFLLKTGDNKYILNECKEFTIGITGFINFGTIDGSIGINIESNIIWDVGINALGVFGITLDENKFDDSILPKDEIIPLLRTRDGQGTWLYNDISATDTSVSIKNNNYNIFYITRSYDASGNAIITCYINGSRPLYSVTDPSFGEPVINMQNEDSHFGTLISDTQIGANANLQFYPNRIAMYDVALTPTQIYANMLNDCSYYDLSINLLDASAS